MQDYKVIHNHVINVQNFNMKQVNTVSPEAVEVD
jgi:hypothetical protein